MDLGNLGFVLAGSAFKRLFGKIAVTCISINSYVNLKEKSDRDHDRSTEITYAIGVISPQISQT